MTARPRVEMTAHCDSVPEVEICATVPTGAKYVWLSFGPNVDIYLSFEQAKCLFGGLGILAMDGWFDANTTAKDAS